ncbi:phage holin [Lacticaseibacillus rhamnosus]|nr:phage holin [Lacticaseibacillus rhamnosus]OAU60373.1 phage holin [Lacticaseibacillus rhamnosus]
MNNWTELLVSLAVAAIPIIGAWISKQLLANKQALTLVKVLGPLANAAVTAAEQLGVTQAIDGAVKKSTAIQAVKDGLKSLSFTSTDEQTIANAVEKAYADLKDSLAETYPKREGIQVTDLHYYPHVAYANSADGTVDFSTKDSLGKSYMGAYFSYDQEDSNDPSKYQWTKLVGPSYGDPVGAEGPKGESTTQAAPSSVAPQQ